MTHAARSVIDPEAWTPPPLSCRLISIMTQAA